MHEGYAPSCSNKGITRGTRICTLQSGQTCLHQLPSFILISPDTLKDCNLSAQQCRALLISINQAEASLADARNDPVHGRIIGCPSYK